MSFNFCWMMNNVKFMSVICHVVTPMEQHVLIESEILVGVAMRTGPPHVWLTVV